jgi:predicted O-methyltransferase YrrM
MDDVAAALAADNKELRASLRALEQSRWNRLNPFRLLRRTSGTRAAPAPATRSAIDEAREANPRLADFEREIVARGRFTHLWALGHAGWWEPICIALDGRAVRVIEVGSFEGLSAAYLLWRLPEAEITCVDTFEGSLEHEGTNTVPADLERVFEENVALVDTARVRKRVGRSSVVLPRLAADGERFDLVYLDGSHFGLDVLVDAAVSWQLLDDGGFLVFDDYLWAELGEDALLRPRPAIDAFLALVEGKYDVVFAHEQVAVRKRL